MLTINEANSNRCMIWLIIKLAVESIDKHSLKFVPGEYILRSFKEEHKVDAYILDGDLEVCLLETSGKLLYNESGKHGLDHIKATFGTLSVFNAIYKKYFWGSESTALKLRIPFLNARRKFY